MTPAELPPLDAGVLSHLHGDHWDRVARRTLDRSPPVLTTEHAAPRLARYGFDGRGLRTWQESVLRRGTEQLAVVSLPGLHARGLIGRLLPPVMGSMLEHIVDGVVRRRVYLSGDTLDGPHLDAVRERFPDIDVAIVHLGGTRVLAPLSGSSGALRRLPGLPLAAGRLPAAGQRRGSVHRGADRGARRHRAAGPAGSLADQQRPSLVFSSSG